MSQEEYDTLSVIDGFADAFPNVITIDEFNSEEEKVYQKLYDDFTARRKENKLSGARQ